MNWKVIQGNNIDILKEYPDNHFDSIVTDPPYGIAFLGKDWDSKKATETTSKLVALRNLPSGMKHTSLADDLEFQYWMRDVFLECNRVLKSGGHLLAFSAARTYHHMAMAAQTAGFEVRDQLMWLYGSGFPKAQDIGKALDKRGVENDFHGWKTALKPAHEPIVMARKPFKGSCIDNILEHGVGALNIDASRIESEPRMVLTRKEGHNATLTFDGSKESEHKDTSDAYEMVEHNGRYPSNVIMDSEAGAILDQQAPKTGNASSSKRTKTGMTGTGASLQWHKSAGESNGISDGLSGASKFFYCPKVSRKERQVGFDVKTENTRPRGEAFGDSNLLDENKTGNNHPTVKPVELMKYLIKLVTPEGGKVLDPFNGSGSTGMAAVELGYEYVGCELDPDYVEIANKRIAAWEKQHDTPANNLFEDN